MNPDANHQLTRHTDRGKNQELNQLLDDPHIWRASDALRDQACTKQALQPVSTGFRRLDAELPDGGWPCQGLMELLCPAWGIGEMSLLSPAMAQLSQQGRWLVWVSPPWQPYAPGLVHAGIDIGQVLIIRPGSDRDALWAMEECLQSGQCSAVLGWPRKILPQQLKRLHLAAQKGDSLSVIMRQEQWAQQPSPAPLRIELAPLRQGLSLRILKRRGRWASDWIQLPLPGSLSIPGRSIPKTPDTPCKAGKTPVATGMPPAVATSVRTADFSSLSFTH